MLIYYIIYILLYFSKKRKFLILTLFTVLRYDVGGDFNWYYNLALKVEIWRYEILEPLNKIFYLIIWKLNLPAQSIIIIYGMLTLFFIQKALRYKKIDKNTNTYLTLFCFPMFLFLFFYFMRQGLAVAIVFYSYKYIREKKNYYF